MPARRTFRVSGLNRHGGSRRLARSAAALVLLTLASSVLAHSEPPPPPPPPPVLKEIRTERIAPLRWSWVHWWEANRDAYLTTVSQGEAPQLPDPQAMAELRGQVAAAALRYLDHEDPRVQAAAALALGRMRAELVGDRLATFSQAAESVAAKRAALVAIGLVGGADNETYLVGRETEKQNAGDIRVAVLAGLAMMADLQRSTLDGLRRLIDSPRASEGMMAALALKRHAEAGDVPALRQVLQTSESPWVVSEAMLILGRLGDPGSVPILRDVLLNQDSARKLRVWKYLEETGRQIAQAASGAMAANRLAREAYERARDEWSRNNPGQQLKPEAPRVVGQETLVVGLTDVYMARLRASAAIALGETDDERAGAALVAVLGQTRDEYNNLPKAFAIMALGRRKEIAALPPLMEILGNRRDPESPLRGFAALALGLYARPVQTPQGEQNQPRYDLATRLLAERLMDVNETLEVRCACAVGLGLTQRTENLEYLIQAGQTIRPGDQAVAGYVLLARAMCGDRGVPEPAVKLARTVTNRGDSEGLLARRAAVLAIGVAGGDEAIPALVSLWDTDNYYVNREVLIALSMCNALGAGRYVVDALVSGKEPGAEAYLLDLLGELLLPERPQRLAFFLADSNFTIRDDSRIPYQTMANEFLMQWLIPAFPEPWR